MEFIKYYFITCIIISVIFFTAILFSNSLLKRKPNSKLSNLIRRHFISDKHEE